VAALARGGRGPRGCASRRLRSTTCSPRRTGRSSPYQAVVRATGETLPLVDRLCWPDAVVADILTLRARAGRRVRRVPVATLVPHVHPVRRVRAGRRTRSARACRARRSAARSGGRWSASRSRGCWQGRDEAQRDAQAPGAGAARPRARLHQRPARAGGDVPPAGVPAHVAAVGARGRAAGLGAAGPRTSSCPPGDEPLVLVAPSTVHDPEFRLMRNTLRGAGRRARTGHGRVEPAPAADRRAHRRARQRAARAVAELQPRDAAVRRGRLPRRARDADARTGVGLRGSSPARPRATWRRNAARVDWACVGVRVRWRFTTPGPLRLAVRRALRDWSLRARARELAAWAAGNDVAARAAELVEALAAQGRLAEAQGR